MVLITEIALSTCKAKVSVSFRYCTNISCFFSSPSSPSFSGSFCGVGGKFWLSSEVSSSEPEENVKYCTLKIKWAFNQPSLKRCLTAAQLFMKLYEIKKKKKKRSKLKHKTELPTTFQVLFKNNNNNLDGFKTRRVKSGHILYCLAQGHQ